MVELNIMLLSNVCYQRLVQDLLCDIDCFNVAASAGLCKTLIVSPRAEGLDDKY